MELKTFKRYTINLSDSERKCLTDTVSILETIECQIDENIEENSDNSIIEDVYTGENIELKEIKQTYNKILDLLDIIENCFAIL